MPPRRRRPVRREQTNQYEVGALRLSSLSYFTITVPCMPGWM
jgi:hypothetical protein